MKIIIILAICVIALADKRLDDAFKAYKASRVGKQVGGVYKNCTAEAKGKAQFIKNQQRLAEWRASRPNRTYEKELWARYADTDPVEALKGLCGTIPPPMPRALPQVDPAATTYPAGPASVDWSPYLTPIKDQKQCGSCWSFASITSVEAKGRIKTNKTYCSILAPQHLVDCSRWGNNGCG
jgi:Papain family cysteine protease